MSRLQKAFENRNKKQNKIEIIKESKKPMSVFDRLEDISKGGYENLSKEDSSYFLKCFGLYDKGEDFMLRVRIPAGAVSYDQAIRLGEIAQKYGNDYIDITTRMQVEFRYLKIEDIYSVLKELKEVGITTFQTGVDNFRNIVTDPLDGIAFDNIIPSTKLLHRLQDMFIEQREWVSVLPRKFNTAILGSLSNSCNIFGHDCSFVLAQKDGIFGFNVYLGAKVGVQNRDANLFVTEDEAPLFYRTLIEIFRDYGFRDNRNKNRFHFLLTEVGMENFIEELKLKADYEFGEAGITMVQSQAIALNSNRVLQKDGKFAYKLIVASGIFSGSKLIEFANEAKNYGTGDLRFTYDQNVYAINLHDIKAFENSNIIKEYSKYNNLYFRDMIACAGTATCSFGVIPNKPDAIEMADYLNNTIAIENANIRMNWSACPKGCGIHGIADIGFEGCKAKDSDNNRVNGVHIFIGGKITRRAKEAHILHKALPITEAKFHIKYLLKTYKSFKKRCETYEEFDDRYISGNYSFQALAFYTKINYILNEKLNLGVELELDYEPKSSKREEYELFSFGIKLFRLLTNEKRFESVVGLEPTKVRPRKIKRDEVTKLNPKVPLKLSEIIYNMTHQDKKERAQVFSEVLVALKEV